MQLMLQIILDLSYIVHQRVTSCEWSTKELGVAEACPRISAENKQAPQNLKLIYSPVKYYFLLYWLLLTSIRYFGGCGTIDSGEKSRHVCPISWSSLIRTPRLKQQKTAATERKSTQSHKYHEQSLTKSVYFQGQFPNKKKQQSPQLNIRVWPLAMWLGPSGQLIWIRFSMCLREGQIPPHNDL